MDLESSHTTDVVVDRRQGRETPRNQGVQCSEGRDWHPRHSRAGSCSRCMGGRGSDLTAGLAVGQRSGFRAQRSGGGGRRLCDAPSNRSRSSQRRAEPGTWSAGAAFRHSRPTAPTRLFRRRGNITRIFSVPRVVESLATRCIAARRLLSTVYTVQPSARSGVKLGRGKARYTFSRSVRSSSASRGGGCPSSPSGYLNSHHTRDLGFPIQEEIAISRLPVTAGGHSVTRQDRLPLPDLSPSYRY